MKKVFSKIHAAMVLCAGVLLTFVIAGCSDFRDRETASVSFLIDGSMLSALKSSARSVEVSSARAATESETYYFPEGYSADAVAAGYGESHMDGDTEERNAVYLFNDGSYIVTVKKNKPNNVVKTSLEQTGVYTYTGTYTDGVFSMTAQKIRNKETEQMDDVTREYSVTIKDGAFSIKPEEAGSELEFAYLGEGESEHYDKPFKIALVLRGVNGYAQENPVIRTVVEGVQTVVSFDEIPVGSSVSVAAVVYSSSGEGYVWAEFFGESEEKEIEAGNNSVNLVLKRVGAGEIVHTAEGSAASVDDSFYLTAYDDGFYIIVHEEQGIVSMGTYTENSYTELAYRLYQGSDLIPVTNPVAMSLDRNAQTYAIASASGISITFSSSKTEKITYTLEFWFEDPSSAYDYTRNDAYTVGPKTVNDWEAYDEELELYTTGKKTFEGYAYSDYVSDPSEGSDGNLVKTVRLYYVKNVAWQFGGYVRNQESEKVTLKAFEDGYYTIYGAKNDPRSKGTFVLSDDDKYLTFTEKFVKDSSSGADTLTELSEQNQFTVSTEDSSFIFKSATTQEFVFVEPDSVTLHLYFRFADDTGKYVENMAFPEKKIILKDVTDESYKTELAAILLQATYLGYEMNEQKSGNPTVIENDEYEWYLYFDKVEVSTLLTAASVSAVDSESGESKYSQTGFTLKLYSSLTYEISYTDGDTVSDKVVSRGTWNINQKDGSYLITEREYFDFAQDDLSVGTLKTVSSPTAQAITISSSTFEFKTVGGVTVTFSIAPHTVIQSFIGQGVGNNVWTVVLNIYADGTYDIVHGDLVLSEGKVKTGDDESELIVTETSYLTPVSYEGELKKNANPTAQTVTVLGTGTYSITSVNGMVYTFDRFNHEVPTAYFPASYRSKTVSAWYATASVETVKYTETKVNAVFLFDDSTMVATTYKVTSTATTVVDTRTTIDVEGTYTLATAENFDDNTGSAVVGEKNYTFSITKGLFAIDGMETEYYRQSGDAPVPTPKSLAITSESSPSIKVGERITLDATMTYSNGDIEKNPDGITWTVDREDVVTVENGVVKGVAVGTAKVSASLEDIFSDSFTVTVSVATAGVSVELETISGEDLGLYVELSSKKNADGSVTLTATPNASVTISSYEWTVTGTGSAVVSGNPSVTEAGGSYVIQAGSLTEGTYNVSLVLTINGDVYSGSMVLKVTAE